MASSSSCQKRYDVFLSFRGEDTRNNFTAHLYQALCQKGINTFIDDDKLQRGQVISPALVAAIQNSMFAIVVLSQNYASSIWCLEELVKIVECMKSRGQRVLPIFYNVDPSDVRKQRGLFGEALTKHEENSENLKRVQSWKDALTQVANISGWDSRNKNEPLLIKEVGTFILNTLLSSSASDTENLVGIDARIKEIEVQLCLESDGPLVVGIWGMGGIGKTTLAKAVYNKIKSQFEACSFFENVGEYLAKKGLIKLQQKFLSQLLEEPSLNMKVLTSIKQRLHSKKVLVVLDNVNDPIVLKSLVGNWDWFRQGSRIIITTRDKRLLISHGVLNYYEAEGFNDDEAFEFLSHYSLKHELLKDDCMELSKEVMGYAQGIPLALEVLGSFLFSLTKEEWRNQLEKLKSTPDMKIQEVLKASYDGLDDKEKNIFLDIACFFKGEDKDYVMKILDGCGFFSLSGIRALIDKSLITISYSNVLMMHDLIQEMGREIVRQQSLGEPGKWSRLWFHEDICDVLRKNTVLEKLRFMDLSHSKNMIETPNFSGVTNLERLVLKDCESLRKIHSSLGDLKNLSFLNLKNCKMLKSLPNSICDLKSLEICILSGCLKIEEFPKDFGRLEMLKELYAEEISLRVLPPSFSLLRNLEVLSFKGYKGAPSTFWSLLRRSTSKSIGSILQPLSGLSSLKELILSDCNLSDETNLSSIGSLSSLEILKLCGNDFVALPSTISRLSILELLDLVDCRKLQALPELPPRIRCIDAENCTSLKDVSYQVLKSLLPTGRWEQPKLTAPDYSRIDVKLGELPVPLKVSIPGSIIPKWIRYQSSGSEVKAELPPNWFNSNFQGFALGIVSHPQFFDQFEFFADFLFDRTSNEDSSSSVDITIHEAIYFDSPLESDHLFLFYVAIPSKLSNIIWSEVSGINVSFQLYPSAEDQSDSEIKRCGVGLVYRNEDGDHSNPPLMIHFNSEDEDSESDHMRPQKRLKCSH